jgi:hypothetical protein
VLPPIVLGESDLREHRDACVDRGTELSPRATTDPNRTLFRRVSVGRVENRPTGVGDERVDLLGSDDAGSDQHGYALHRREDEERDPLGIAGLERGVGLALFDQREDDREGTVGRLLQRSGLRAACRRTSAARAGHTGVADTSFLDAAITTAAKHGERAAESAGCAHVPGQRTRLTTTSMTLKKAG